MGEYLTIIWDTTTPTAKAVEWDNAMIIGASDSVVTETTVYRVTSDDWSTTLSNAGFSSSNQIYRSTSDYFSPSPTPNGTLTVVAYASGASTCYQYTPLTKVDSDIFEVPIKPTIGFCSGQFVRYYPDASLPSFYTNYANGDTGVAFTVEVDGNGDWTGRLSFPNGLSGTTIDNPIPSTAKITTSFKVNDGVQPISDAITNYNINMVALSLENSADKTDYASGSTLFGSQLKDIASVQSMITGKADLFIWALPGNANPTGIIGGSNPPLQWSQLKNFIGTDEHVSLIKARPASSDVALASDIACGYMGMIASVHPHRQITFAQPSMGILEPSNLVDRAYWKDAQVATIMQRRELTGDPYLITYGFTLGSGDSARIEYVRSKGIIAKNLRNGIWAMLVTGIKMSYNGMQTIKNGIKGIFKTLQDQGIVDGLAYVKIPIEEDLKNNTSAGQAARAAREIPSIEIGFYFYNNLERIVITSIKNEA